MPENFPSPLSDPRPGASFHQYQLLEQIGAGGQGVVWSALDRTKKRIVAIKLNEIPSTDQQKADDQVFERQASRLVVLRHPYILPMDDYGLSDKIRYMVTPYIPGGSLEDRLNAGALEINATLQCAAKIASALDYLHMQNVVHRDLKPANILMDYDQNLYVADFGLARILSTSTQAMHTGRGTPPYASPEQHTMAEMSVQSDVYSFGVMLYEMFTGQLPWKGAKILGIQQLHASDEIPDPAEINPNLPAGLMTVLRRLTAANPATRPPSVGAAMQAIYASFNTPPIVISTQYVADELSRHNNNAEQLLQASLAGWQMGDNGATLSLTKFAYIELKEGRARPESIPATTQHFLLYNALLFGYNDDVWWGKVPNPQERSDIAGQLLHRENRAITTRVIRHLTNDMEIQALKLGLPEKATRALLETAIGSKDMALKEESLQFLRSFTPASKKWLPNAFGNETDHLLSTLAQEDTPLGDAAAGLIGHVGSAFATREILKFKDQDRRDEVLLLIQKNAGSLPGSIPANLRARISGEWLLDRLTARPLTLLLAYLSTFAGAALCAGLQVYLTYRLPNFMDLERITISTERGLILGASLGFGILVVKLIVESFPETNTAGRLLIASLAGGVILSATLFIYDVLFLQTVPEITLIAAGCLLWAAGFALAGLIRRRGWKMLLSYASVLLALTTTWFVHIRLAATPSVMSPIFFYEYSWSAAQVMQTILIVSLPLALLANLVRLSPAKE